MEKPKNDRIEETPEEYAEFEKRMIEEGKMIAPGTKNKDLKPANDRQTEIQKLTEKLRKEGKVLPNKEKEQN